MVDQLRSWFQNNHTLVVFLGAQLVAMGAAAAWVIAYSVKRETRVSILETRGASYTVDRLNTIDQRLTVLEQNSNRNAASIERIVDAMTSGLKK